jgi:hypothetical protein
VRLFIKGNRKNATRAATRRGITVRNCKLNPRGDGTFCDAPEGARTAIMRWYGETGIIKSRRGYAPGSLIFFSGAHARRRRRRR